MLPYKVTLILLLWSSLQLYAQKEEDTPLQVGFVLVNGVYNTEVIAPFDIFQHTIFHTSPGMEVFTVAPDTEVITTFEGLKIMPDYHFKDRSMPKIDVLIVASAEHSMDTDLENKELISFIRRAGTKAKYLISLCDGAFVLAKAGLVDGKESTTFPADITRYRKMFPKLKVHEGVSFVHHGNLITSAGGIKSYDAAMYLVDLLYGPEVAKKVGKGLIIDWDLDQILHVKVVQ